MVQTFNFYPYPLDGVCQYCRVTDYHGDPNDWTVGEFLEDVSGKEAYRIMATALASSVATPLYRDGKIMGYAVKGGNAFCCTDCEN